MSDFFDLHSWSCWHLRVVCVPERVGAFTSGPPNAAWGIATIFRRVTVSPLKLWPQSKLDNYIPLYDFNWLSSIILDFPSRAVTLQD